MYPRFVEFCPGDIYPHILLFCDKKLHKYRLPTRGVGDLVAHLTGENNKYHFQTPMDFHALPNSKDMDRDIKTSVIENIRCYPGQSLLEFF